jgi:hypothetical protein
MAYYFITASKDASVYLQQPNQNTGLDQILEVSKVYYGNIKDVSRALIKFDLNALSQSITSGDVTLSNIRLSMRETESNEIPLEYTIFAHPISQSWEMGNGTRFDDISTTGVTWIYRNGESAIDWITTNLASGSDSNPNDGTGGTWYTIVSASQSFNYQTADLNMDVKGIVQRWLSGSLPNEGFILKYSSSLENDTNDYGQLKFFSKETYTIHQPKLVVSWDDQTITTGSLQPLDVISNEVVVRVKNLNSEYKVDSVKKLRIVGREKYPIKTFTNTFSYNDVKYLPITTYYQVKDLLSDDIIIPFSSHSKVSCDTSGNFIEFNFSNWEVNRAYKLEFKMVSDGDEIFYDDDITFNIIEK